MSNRAVFLDKDGTIARDVPYCHRVEDFKLLPTVPETIKLLNVSGFKVVIVTNQSGIARGYFIEETLNLIHRKMRDELTRHGTWVDAIYFCPHHPDDRCECRKPSPGLLLDAASELGIDLRLSYMVGDGQIDVKAGRSVGCKTTLVTTGPNLGELEGSTPDHIASDLYEAAQWIIGDTKSL